MHADGSVDVSRTAVPVGSRGTVSSTVVPSMKVTEPVGVPAPAGPATVAVKVMSSPALAVIVDATSWVVVARRGVASILATKPT